MHEVLSQAGDDDAGATASDSHVIVRPQIGDMPDTAPAGVMGSLW